MLLSFVVASKTAFGRVVFNTSKPKLHYFSRYLSKMRFVQFALSGRRGVGVELTDGGDVVDLGGFDSTMPDNMRDFLSRNDYFMPKAIRAVESGQNVLKRSTILTIDAPITNPEKIICIGMNYVDHCLEQNAPIPTEPVVFSKFNNAITGPFEDILYPEETQQLDWEVELVIVIGKCGSNIKKENAMDHVFGYTVAHDVSARDWQFKNGGQFLLGKTMNQFCPLGPAIVMKEDIADPHNLKLWTKVNGVTKQDSNTNQLVFKTEEVVAFLSRFMVLTPGDIILTGTPPGVGVFRKPQEFLKVGDVVEVGIEGIGTLKNKIVGPNDD